MSKTMSWIMDEVEEGTICYECYQRLDGGIHYCPPTRDDYFEEQQ